MTGTKNKWVVRSDSERDEDSGKPLYWKMDFGWASLEALEDTDIWTSQQKNQFTPPLIGGQWQTLSAAEKEFNEKENA